MDVLRLLLLLLVWLFISALLDDVPFSVALGSSFRRLRAHAGRFWSLRAHQHPLFRLVLLCALLSGAGWIDHIAYRGAHSWSTTGSTQPTPQEISVCFRQQGRLMSLANARKNAIHERCPYGGWMTQGACGYTQCTVHGAAPVPWP